MFYLQPGTIYSQTVYPDLSVTLMVFSVKHLCHGFSFLIMDWVDLDILSKTISHHQSIFIFHIWIQGKTPASSVQTPIMGFPFLKSISAPSPHF